VSLAEIEFLIFWLVTSSQFIVSDKVTSAFFYPNIFNVLDVFKTSCSIRSFNQILPLLFHHHSFIKERSFLRGLCIALKNSFSFSPFYILVYYLYYNQ
jgi:hypothetical protein